MEWAEDGVSPQLHDDAAYPEPENVMQARYSPWFSIAAGIVYPDLIGLAPYEPERIANPRLRGLLKWIIIYVLPELAQADRATSLGVNYLKVRLKGRMGDQRPRETGGCGRVDQDFEHKEKSTLRNNS